MTEEQQQNNQNDSLGDSGFSSQAEAIRAIIQPHYQELSNGIINKDLKISNLTEIQQSLVVEMTDVALQCIQIGCYGFAWHLIQVRETMLCSSSSLKGFERQVEVSNINIHKLPAEMKDRWKIFNTRKDGQQSQNNPY